MRSTRAELVAIAERLRRSSVAAAALAPRVGLRVADLDRYQRGRADGLVAAAELVDALAARLEWEGEDAGPGSRIFELRAALNVVADHASYELALDDLAVMARESLDEDERDAAEDAGAGAEVRP